MFAAKENPHVSSFGRRYDKSMSEFLSSITTLLGQAERRVEIAAQNIANASTPGFRRYVHFKDLIGGETGARATSATDFTQGQVIETGSPLDLALTGPGFFVVRGEDGLRLTRSGKFVRAPDGAIASADGLVLQIEGGGDLTLTGPDVRIYDDGTIVDGDRPVGKLWIADVEKPQDLRREGDVFVIPDGIAPVTPNTLVRQGAIEAANVSSAAEMLTIMEAVRQAEAGQRLMQAHDQALSRTLSLIGQN